MNTDYLPLLEASSNSAEGRNDPERIQPFAPMSITTFAAGLLEPFISVVALLICAAAVKEHPWDRPVALLAVMTLLVSFPAENRFHHRLPRALFDIIVGWVAKVAFLALSATITDVWRFFDTTLLAIWVLVVPVLHALSQLIARAWIRYWYARETVLRPALVVGAGGPGLRVKLMLEGRMRYGLRFVGFLEDRGEARLSDESRDHVIGRFTDLSDVVRKHGVRDVYVTLPLSMQPRIRKLLGEIRDEAVSIYLVPDVFGRQVIQGRVFDLDGTPVVSLLATPFEGVNGLVKRLSDVAIASVATLVLSPVMLAIALGVKLSSPGPVIFKQRRHGMDGREIEVWKFRSMTVQDNGTHVRQATRGDARITPFGAFLRKTSLDELPQFLNVLQGRMSVVGPRPHAVAHNDMYEKLIPAYMVRHKVKPGITGWAQVNGLRGETDTNDKMVARVHFDLDYLRMWSLGMDLRIIARTVRVLFGDKNAY